jgi:hypothetical protein
VASNRSARRISVRRLLTGIDSKLARLLDVASMADATPREGPHDLLTRRSEGMAEWVTLVDEVNRHAYAALVKLAV